MKSFLVGALAGAAMLIALNWLDLFTVYYSRSEVGTMGNERFEYLVSHGACREITMGQSEFWGLRCPRFHLP